MKITHDIEKPGQFKLHPRDVSIIRKRVAATSITRDTNEVVDHITQQAGVFKMD